MHIPYLKDYLPILTKHKVKGTSQVKEILIAQLFKRLGKFGRTASVKIEKSQFFIFFLNWEKLRSPARVTFKNLNFPFLCELGKALGN